MNVFEVLGLIISICYTTCTGRTYNPQSFASFTSCNNKVSKPATFMTFTMDTPYGEQYTLSSIGSFLEDFATDGVYFFCTSIFHPPIELIDLVQLEYSA